MGRLRNMLGAGLVIYLLLAFAGLATERREIFPFYSWALFPFTPKTEVTVYRVRLLEWNGHRFSSPVPIHDADDRVPLARSIELFEVIQRLGRALDTGGEADYQEARDQLEGRYMRRPFHYEIIAQTYHPVEYWRSGTAEERLLHERKDSGRDEGEAEP